jgi:hypothetical protein
MTKLATLASRIPFAHLLGVKAADNIDDDEKKKREDAKAEDEDKDKPDGKAEDDKPGDDDTEKDKRDAKGSKSKASDDGEDDDEDKEKKEQAVRASERARCAAILAHGIKTGAVRQACAYAFDTGMSAAVAVATLDATAEDRKPAGSTLADRMAGVVAPSVRPEASQLDKSDPKAIAAGVIASARRARGEAAS